MTYSSISDAPLSNSLLPSSSMTHASGISAAYRVASRQSGRSKRSLNLIRALRRWIDQVNINNPHLAHWICRMIPTQCPFERDIVILGQTVAHIPPLCKLNPFYEEVVSLRFRALCYLADECGEDVQHYC